MIMDVTQILAINAAVVGVCFLGLWLLSIALKDPSFVDSWWAIGMLVIAWSGFFIPGGGGPHALALTLLCTAWGLRLGLYLLWRWRKDGPDRRYVTMMGKAQAERGWSFAKASLLLVFAMQAPLQFVVCLPVQLGQVAPTTALGPLAWAGVALTLVGIAFESIGDLQLVRFKADPANKGKVLDTGLWRYTRHPNYFGDACVWWGLYLIAAETGWIGAASIVGPILITVLLTRWSGVPTVEGRMRRKRPDYEAYVQRTSSFIPMPPKRA
jgi:steroid 5-alpha reductase family enzyme